MLQINTVENHLFCTKHNMHKDNPYCEGCTYLESTPKRISVEMSREQFLFLTAIIGGSRVNGCGPWSDAPYSQLRKYCKEHNLPIPELLVRSGVGERFECINPEYILKKKG